MEFFPDIKTIVSFGPLSITWYAAFIISGALLGYYFSIRTFKKWGYQTQIFEDFFLYMLPIGICGARLYYVLFEWKNYIDNPIKIFYIWEGGLAIHGGLIAATLFGIWYFRKHAVDGLRILDAIFPNVLLAQAIGRWGNFMNQEAFGRIVDASYYDGWPAFIKDQMFIDQAYREPTFLYESMLNLLGWFLIRFVYRKFGRRKRGDLFYAYLCWYGVVRVWIESMRSDALMLGSLKMAQIISLVGVFVGLAGIMGVWDKVLHNLWPFTRQKPIVIFDLDGTLIDSKKLIFESFQHTFRTYKPDYQLSDEELQSFMGPTLKETFSKYFKANQIDELIACYREYNHQHHDEYVTLFPHVKETLSKLKEDGYVLALVSNKLHDTVDMALQLFDLHSYFDIIIGGDDVSLPKPNTEGILLACEKTYHNHDDVIYVGDSITDIKTCKNMAAFSIAMIHDKNQLEKMQAQKPCMILYDLKDIVDVVKEEKEWSDNTIW